LNRFQLKRDLEALLRQHNVEQRYGVLSHELSAVMLESLDSYISTKVQKNWNIPIPKQVD
jgi:hypothetical protein